jgi:translation initiation factor IF-3
MNEYMASDLASDPKKINSWIDNSRLVKSICYLHGRVMLHSDKCKECRHEGECIERL